MLEGVVDCLSGVQRALAASGITPGSITHTIAQLQFALEQKIFGATIDLERNITDKLGKLKIDRDIDIIASKITGSLQKIIHTEIKTGASAPAALDLKQMKQDAAIAFKAVADKTVAEFANVWKLESITIGEKEKKLIQKRLEDSAAAILQEGIGSKAVKEAIKAGNFETKFGEGIKQAIQGFNFVDESGKVFKPALSFIFGPNGPVAQVALEEASHSPNFQPAMEVLFGSSGKIAKAASGAAGEANLNPAFQTLETKLEQGVGDAMKKAGDAAQKISAKDLADKVGAGIGALGSAISAIPALHKSLKDLGEAWDKPLKTTDDYMNLLSALGGTISQFGSTLQAFAALTQLASAAQAVFNAVMAMNPVVLVVLAVIALIVVIALLIVYWDKVKAVLRDNPWIAVVVAMTGVIGLIIVVIAYWDEIKLAVLKAANFISIQVQRIGYFFLGVGRLIGQIWDVVVASLANAGISILNGFITIGVGIQNFFIGIINWIIDKYNALADSALGSVIGLEKAAKLPEVDVNTKLIPPKEVPKIDVDAAFKTPEIKGGLEDEIAKQEEAVKKAQDADDKRRKEKAAKDAAAAAPPPGAPGAPGAVPGMPGVPGVPGTPGIPGAPPVPGLPAVPPMPAPSAGAVTPPKLPEGPLPAAPAAPAAAGPASVTVNLGGVTVNVNADKLEANAAQMLSDEIVSALASRLGSLLAEQNFRTGTRPE